MKKVFYGLLLAVVIFAGAFLLLSCGENDDNSGDNTENTTYVDYSKLNYNPKFSDGNGYVIHDEIDFNTLKVAEGCSISTVKIGTHGTASYGILKDGNTFRNYTFNEVGTYTVEVSVKAKALTTERFEVVVEAGNYPTGVKFDFIDGNDAKIDTVYAGSSFKLLATLMSGDKEIHGSIDGLSVYWGTDTYASGNLTKELEYPNCATSNTYSIDLNVNTVNNVGKTVVTKFTHNYTVNDSLLKTEENPQGIYFDLGSKFSAETATADVSATVDGGIFAASFTAEYRFLDGETKALKVAYNEATLSKVIDNVYVYIKYNGEDEYKTYNYASVNSSDGFANYVKGDEDYQFSPTKTSAEIYLAICARLDASNLEFRPILGTEKTVSIKKEALKKFALESFTYSRKNLRDAYFSKNQTAQVVNDTVTMWSIIGSNTEFQRFTPNMSIDRGSYGDYYITVENENVGYNKGAVTYYNGKNYALGYFVPTNAGKATVTFKSCYTDESVQVTVNVINPVISANISVNSSENYGITVPDYTKCVVVTETHYDSTTSDRAPYASETVTQMVDYYDINSLAYLNKGYTVTVSTDIVLEDKSVTASKNVKFYQIPDLTVSILGKTYSSSDALSENAVLSDKKARDIYGNDDGLRFYGYVPTLVIAVPENQLSLSYADYGFAVTAGYPNANAADNIGRNLNGDFYVKLTDFRNGKTTSTTQSTYAEVPILFIKLFAE